jgi:hypothetical protein
LKFLIDVFKKLIYLKKYGQILRVYRYIWKNLGIKRPKRSILASEWGFERCLIALMTLLFGSLLAQEEKMPQKKEETFETRVNVNVSQDVEDAESTPPFYVPLHTTDRMYDQDIRPDYQEENWYRSPYDNNINPYKYPSKK